MLERRFFTYYLFNYIGISYENEIVGQTSKGERGQFKE